MKRLPDIAESGVYYLPWTGPAGEIYLVAVSNSGRKLCEATVFSGQDPEAVELMLWELLDQDEPRLRLVG